MVSRVCCAWFFALSFLVGCDATLEGQLSEEQANRIVVALDRAGIKASKDKEDGFGTDRKYQVKVSRSAVSGALTALRQDALPREQEPGIKELFDGKALVSSAIEERVRYAAALSGELSRSIETIEGVLDARVHVALPPPAPLDGAEARPRPQASVLITYRPAGAAFGDDDVQRLIAGAVHGLAPHDVSVVRIKSSRSRSPKTHLVYVGPIAVSRATASLLRGILAVMLGLNVVLMAALVWLFKRARPRVISSASADRS
ncbi:MAG: secretion protein [Myxococcales bacterium]|nr:secretion protein [Myxococcales bacterium]MCB9708097.1 secretion protein [Myxococcales bacterium]